MNDDHSDLDLPREFGDYQLLRTVGRGGMGQVYLAKVKAKGLVGVDKLCVVKTLQLSHDPEYQRRFVDEARLIVLLTHRNICHVFDAGCFEDQYYLAMEHIDGHELRQVEQWTEGARQGLPVDVALFIVKEVLEALDAAHRMKHPLSGQPLKVVHRDVSPQNVMLSAEGEVKLIDFGLAESSQKLERTAPRIVMGKIAYMSPEQARGEAVDGRADQFAAAVMLYELLTNERYYGALAIDDVWRMSGRGGFTPSRLSSVGPGLAAVITKATAPQREDRYESCGDLRAALQQVELQRGTVAGSRELRAALRRLQDAPASTTSKLQASTLEVLVVQPPTSTTPSAEPATTQPTPAAPREKTRTFHIRATTQPGLQVEDAKTEIGFVIEGLRASELPPALQTGDVFHPVSLMASAPATAAPSSSNPLPTAGKTPSRPEATVVVRERPSQVTDVLPVVVVPAARAHHRPAVAVLVGAAAAVAVVAVVIAIVVWVLVGTPSAGAGEASSAVHPTNSLP